MRLTIGDAAPDFTAQSTEGEISFHDWLGDSWGVLFSHPRAFTPVCTTELGYMASIKPEFDNRGAKIIAISTDPAEDSRGWSDDIEKLQGTAVNYPIIADTDHAVAKAYGMLPADVSGDPTARTPAQYATLRNVFIIGPDKQIKLVLIYPMSTGRNFDEILRVLDSLQLTANEQLSTPAQWQPGEDAILAGSVSDEEAKTRYPDGWEQPLPYMRVVPTR
jgi:alkyl hydroperoxide reductase subunit AhpC